MFNIVIYSDNMSYVGKIGALISKTLIRNNINVDIVCKTSDELSLLNCVLEKRKVNIFFLDVLLNSIENTEYIVNLIRMMNPDAYIMLFARKNEMFSSLAKRHNRVELYFHPIKSAQIEKFFSKLCIKEQISQQLAK